MPELISATPQMESGMADPERSNVSGRTIVDMNAGFGDTLTSTIIRIQGPEIENLDY